MRNRPQTTVRPDGSWRYAQTVPGLAVSPEELRRTILRGWLAVGKARACSELNVVVDGIDGTRSRYCNISREVPYTVLEELSGLAAFLDGPHSGGKLNLTDKRRFGRYNPALVSWVTRNVVPGPGDKVYIALTQSLYDRYVRNIARAFHRTYVLWSRNAAAFRAEGEVLLQMINGARPWNFAVRIIRKTG